MLYVSTVSLDPTLKKTYDIYSLVELVLLCFSLSWTRTENQGKANFESINSHQIQNGTLKTHLFVSI